MIAALLLAWALLVALLLLSITYNIRGLVKNTDLLIDIYQNVEDELVAIRRSLGQELELDEEEELEDDD